MMMARGVLVAYETATLPLPVRHGEPAGAAQVDIGQSCASTCRKSSSLTLESFHVCVSEFQLFGSTYETDVAMVARGQALCFIGETQGVHPDGSHRPAKLSKSLIREGKVVPPPGTHPGCSTSPNGPATLTPTSTRRHGLAHGHHARPTQALQPAIATGRSVVAQAPTTVGASVSSPAWTTTCTVTFMTPQPARHAADTRRDSGTERHQTSRHPDPTGEERPNAPLFLTNRASHGFSRSRHGHRHRGKRTVRARGGSAPPGTTRTPLPAHRSETPPA